MQSAKSTHLKKLFVIGLVGGIAAGKSFVAKMFESMGAPVIDADELAHAVLAQPLILRRLKQVFGDRIVKDGVIDRGELAKIVFGESPQAAEARTQLEAMVHPAIHAAAVQRLLKLKEAENPPIAVILDAPLLIEAGWSPMCDAILFIDTPYDERLKRCRERGWTESQFKHREAAQMDLDKKRTHSTHILSDSGDEDQLKRKLARMLAELKNAPN